MLNKKSKLKKQLRIKRKKKKKERRRLKKKRPKWKGENNFFFNLIECIYYELAWIFWANKISSVHRRFFSLCFDWFLTTIYIILDIQSLKFC